MDHITKLTITLELRDDQKMADVVAGLPEYCRSTFRPTGGSQWRGEFQISCPVAPKLADGDFEDDFAPCFPALLRMKKFNAAKFELAIAVGEPANEFFELADQSVALLAVLGASVVVQTAAWNKRMHNEF